MSIEVTRMGGSSGTASVLCGTRNNTAVSGTDYTAISQTLDWGSGDTSGKFCNVPISGAYPFSGQKTFIVQISDATGAALGRVSSATVTINGSGAGTAGTLTLSAPTYAVAQNAGSVTISVNRTGGSSGSATVAYATANGSAIAGTDYTSEQGVVSWASGDATPKTFLIPVSNAAPFTGAKTLAVAIAGAQGAALGTANTSSIVSINGDAASPPTVSLSASPSSIASGGSSMLTWSASNATSCTASGGWSGSLAMSGSQSTGALGAPTTYMLGCTGGGGTVTQSVTVSISAQTPTGGAVSRPSYNTGNGFFVLNGKLYDANGNEFRIRGVDRAHYDSDSAAGIAKSGANAVRMFMYGLSVGAPKYVSILQTQHIAYNEVPIPSVPLFPDGTTTSGNTSTTELAAGVAWWVANAATFAPISKYLIINIANEWGPSNSTVWRDAYISAITSLRSAGYLGPLLIDTGGWGQDTGDLLNYSTAVFNSDPQKNIIFSLHIYGSIPTDSVAPDLAALAALSASAGMVFIVGEFGPGRDIGPSPTETTPADIITAAEANGIGWIGWAWDDNDLANCMSDNNWFSMTINCGTYTQASDLTIFGQDVVLNPTYGLSVLATPASIF
jgi:hypothetical protein